VAGEIFGRDEELAAIAAMLSLADLPRAVVLEGEPGIGKTVVWQEAVTAAERDYQVLSCRTAEPEAPLSFAGIADLLGDRIDALSELPPPQRRALEVALLLADPTDARPDPAGVSFAFLGVLRALAGETPLLVAIDDIQWLDPQSRLLLEFACRRLRDERIALVATFRREGDRPLPLSLEAALGADRVERLRLPPLSMGALQQVFRTRLDVVLQRPVLRRVHETSGGNPFFALELARALGREPPPPPDAALPLTPGLEELLERRLADVPAPVEELLLVCSALAAPTIGLLERYGAEPSALRDAVGRDLLVIDGARVRFSHPLLASAVYYGASDERRWAVHRRLAELSDDPEARALHLCRATVLPDESVAEAIEDAADRAYRRSAVHAAGWFALQARRLTPRDREEELFRRGLKVCDYTRPLGATPEVEQTIRELVASAKPGRDRARALFEASSKAENVAEKLRLSDEALREAGADARLQARIRGQQSRALEGVGRLDDAAGQALGELESAEAAGDPALVLAAIARLGRMRFLTGHGIDDELMQRGTELEGRLSSFVAYHSATSSLADQLTWSDVLDEARLLFQDLFERTVRAGAQNSLVTLHLQLAEVENRAANWRAGEVHARQGGALARDVGHASIEGLQLFQEALAWTHLGRLADAAEQLTEAATISRETDEDLYFVHYESLLGFLELSRDDYEKAYRRLGPLPDRIAAMGARDPGFFYLVPNVIEALVGLGRLDEARAQIAQLEQSGRRQTRHRALGVAARGRALVELAEGDTDAALGSAREALDQHQRLPDPFERGRTLLALGAIQRRTRQRRAARESLRAALDLFEELGASVWAGKARSELGRLGGRTPAGKELTPTEERIAELVAKGKTNREVAAELFVTVHTVESALTRIYAKLGVRSRTELAHRLGTAEIKM
jgi:DNA-binding CsgD family transcriptional regulator